MPRNNRIAKNLINIQPGDVFRKEYSKKYYVALNIYKYRIYCVTLGDFSCHLDPYKDNVPTYYKLTSPIKSKSKIISEKDLDLHVEPSIDGMVQTVLTEADLNLVSINQDSRGQKYYSITTEDLQGIKNKIMEVLNI